MNPSDFGGVKLLEQVAKVWSSRRSDFEAECRSGSGSRNEPPPVDHLVQDVANLFEQLARQELEAIRGQYYAGDARPNRTADFTPLPSYEGTQDGRGDETPMQTGDFTPGSREMLTLDTQAMGDADPNAATGTFDPKKAEDEQGFLDDPGFEAAKTSQAFEETPKKYPTRKLPRIPGYQITGTLGHGGMGVVYKARQDGLNRDVALKMILKGEHASSSAVVRFLTEARAIAQLNHPNIVQIYEINEHDDMPYFSLEYCSGGSLDRRLKKEPIPPQRAAELTETLARALGVAHKAGVVHRDMKPANVLVDANGVPKITDFGLARVVDDDSGLTATNSILGSPSYMPPEQAGGGMDNVGPASDQYSLAATLYEFLTGRPPFQGTSPIETVRQVRELEPVPPSKLQPTCPKDLETICLKALSKEIGKRYPSAEAFADDLKAFQEGRPISARPVGPVERLWRWSKRNKKLAALSVALLGLGVAVVVGSTVAALVFREKNVVIASALEDVRDQKRQSDQNYTFARENGVRIIREMPRLINRQVLTQGASADFAKLIRELTAGVGGTIRALPDRMLMFAHLQQAKHAFEQQENLDEAIRHARAAVELAETLALKETDELDKAYGLVANCQGQVAEFLTARYHSLVRQPPAVAARVHAAVTGPTFLDVIAQQHTAAVRLAYEEARKQHQSVVDQQRARLQSPKSLEIPENERRFSLALALSQAAVLDFPRDANFGRGVPLTVEQTNAAVQLMAEAVDLLGVITKASLTEGTEYTMWPLLATVRFDLYRAQQFLRNTPAAEDHLRAAIVASEQAMKVDASPRNRLNLARRCRLLGDLLVFTNRRAMAAEWNEKARNYLAETVAVPELLALLDELASDHYRVGADVETAKPGLSLTQFQSSLRLRELVQSYGGDTRRMQYKVLAAAARCGQTNRVVREVEKLAALPASKNDSVFHKEIALIYGICAGTVGTGDDYWLPELERKKQRDMFVDRTIQALKRNLAILQTRKATAIEFDRLKATTTADPDLDAVRGTAAFQAFLAELQAIKP